MNNIIDNMITRKDFEKSLKLGDFEVFTEAEINAWIKDTKTLIEKSEREELSDIEKSSIDNFNIDFSSLKKVTIIEDDLSKSVVYYRPSQVEWDLDENGEIMKARSGVYKDTPINRKKGVVGMRYGAKIETPKKEDKEEEKDKNS